MLQYFDSMYLYGHYVVVHFTGYSSDHHLNVVTLMLTMPQGEKTVAAQINTLGDIQLLIYAVPDKIIGMDLV